MGNTEEMEIAYALDWFFTNVTPENEKEKEFFGTIYKVLNRAISGKPLRPIETNETCCPQCGKYIDWSYEMKDMVREVRNCQMMHQDYEACVIHDNCVDCIEDRMRKKVLGE